MLPQAIYAHPTNVPLKFTNAGSACSIETASCEEECRMAIVRLSRLSMVDAEDLVARIWCVLAEHPVAAPRLSVRTYADSTVEVALSFRTEHDAELVMHAAPRVTCLTPSSAIASWQAESASQN